ncbi:hypothetical protein PV08_04085 [Exophiala spinifera]|uniref:AttH domain-containing protein n=1 Tax=Exophiala spinifera TaxID=91928 RepID=A0A0D2BE72_9EURO|nr:uncharacterized protein PV08_04085 [Exophiala spinifera]KIW16895.1 hypothetical protein PV08_04085 [Exophiala spinifera]
MRSLFFRVASAILALAGMTTAQCPAESMTFSPILYAGASQVQFTSCASGADSPRVFPINATTFDWWYFDAVSDDGEQALTVIFFTSSALGFSFDLLNTVDPLNVYVFANTGSGNQPVSFPVAATSVTVDTVGNGASGNWVGSGIKFEGASDLSTYTVTFEHTLLNTGISGTFTLTTRGPGHYVCGPLEGGQPEEVLPHVGWVNVMPAASASVDVTILGTQMQFSGNGYHDKNWGDVPFITALNSWYWGHGTFGDYNVVFFDMIDPSNNEKVGGYVLKDGQVVGSTCTTGLQVRPVDAPYPPTLTGANPTQLTITMTLNDGSILNATVTELATQIDVGLYTRWIGTIEGTVNGVTSSGTALWEQFKTQS